MSARLTNAQYRWLTSTVGALTEFDADERFARLGTPRDVAVEVLRERHAALLAAPASLTVNGAVTINQTENIKAIERLIASLLAGPADPSAPVVDDDGEPLTDGELLGAMQLQSRWGRGVRRRRYGNYG